MRPDRRGLEEGREDMDRRHEYDLGEVSMFEGRSSGLRLV